MFLGKITNCKACDRCHVLMAIENGETVQITCFAWFYQICNQLCTKQKGKKIISKLCVNF